MGAMGVMGVIGLMGVIGMRGMRTIGMIVSYLPVNTEVSNNIITIITTI